MDRIHFTKQYFRNILINCVFEIGYVACYESVGKGKKQSGAKLKETQFGVLKSNGIITIIENKTNQ